MEIANPIYDVVFKYLMEDNDIARLIISTIIKKEVVSLEFRPQEKTVELGAASLTVYRLDFSAKIQTDQGLKLVLIEIQKAQFSTDVMRFRKYLGEQYKNEENKYKAKVLRKHTGKLLEVEEDKAIPILSIYFLGYPLDHFQAPVIRVQRDCYDDATNEKLRGQEEFIEALTHDSYIIQVPYLKEDHQSEVEKMLGIFDQGKKTANSHVLNIKEEDYPEKYRSIIRRLQRAIVEPEVRDSMDLEDEITNEFKKMTRTIDLQKECLIESEKALVEKDKTIEEKEKALEVKDKALEEKDKIIRELQKRLENA